MQTCVFNHHNSQSACPIIQTRGNGTGDLSILQELFKQRNVTNKATHLARLIADCLEHSLEKLKPPSIGLEFPTILSLPLIVYKSNEKFSLYCTVQVCWTFSFITSIKTVKKSWSFALQAVYMTFEFALLTTEHEAYAVFDTTEFKSSRRHIGPSRMWDYFVLFF